MHLPISGGLVMNEVSSLSDPAAETLVAQAAQDFMERLKLGEQPEVEEYAQRYPSVAATLRQVLSALQAVHATSLPPEPREQHGDLASSVRRLGDYRILGEVGRGGMGVVYEAEQLSLGRRVALKVLPFAAALDAKQLQRFKNEAQAAAHLHHQNIVPVYAVGCDQGVHYFAMQFIEGCTLAGLIEELRQAGRPTATAAEPATGPYFPPEQESTPFFGVTAHAEVPLDARQREQEAIPAPVTRLGEVATTQQIGCRATNHRRPEFFRMVANLGIQAGEALEHAHQLGVIHRDIKPANILVNLRGNLWITDFGLAHIQNDVKLTMTGDVLGTFRYMSPEQALGKAGILDHRTDIYSLGLTLYEMLTLQPAFAGKDRQELLRQIAFEEPKPPRRLNGSTPGDLETIVLKAIAKSPAERYVTAQELADDLRRFLEDRPIQARRPTVLQRLRKWSRRHQPAVFTGVAAGIILLVLGMLGLVVSNMVITREKNQALMDRQETKKQMFQSRLAEARAGRWSGRMGQRVGGLEALAEAANLARELDLGEDRLLELRHEAVACMALADVRMLREWEGAPAGTLDGLIFDATLEHYARSDNHGNISVRRVADDQELARLPGVGPGAATMIFSPDGALLAVRYHGPVPDLPANSRPWTIRRPGGKAGQTWAANLRVWDWRRAAVTCQPPFPVLTGQCAFGSDGGQIAVGQDGGRVTLFDPTTGKEIKHFEVSSPPNYLAFNGDGTQLAIGSQNSNEVQIREVATGKLQHKFSCPAPVWCVAWQEKDALLAVGCGDGRVYLWVVSTGLHHAILQGHQAEVVGVAFVPGRDLLLSWSWDSSVRLWDPWAGRQLVSFPGAVSGVSKDGAKLASRSESILGLWQVSPGREYRTLPSPPAADTHSNSGGAISPDGRLLAVGTDEGVRLWDLAAMKEGTFLQVGATTGVAFNSSGKVLFTSGKKGLAAWPLRTEQNLVRIGPVEFLISGANQRLGLDRQDRLFALADGRQGMIFNPQKPGTAHLLNHFLAVFATISPDGRWVATGTWNGYGVKIWDAETGQLVRELVHDARVASPTFSPDGQWLVTDAENVDFWKTGSWEFSHRIVRGRGGPLPGALAFSRDGSMAAVPVARDVMHLVESATGKLIARLQAPNNDQIGWLGFTPGDSELVVVTGKPAQARVWDLRLIRSQLRDLGLDWEPAADLPKAHPANVKPLSMEIIRGDLEAWEKFSLVLGFFPFHAEAYYQRGLAGIKRKQWSGALNDFNMAILLKPDHAEAFLQRGIVHEHEKRVAKAIEDFNRAIILKPEFIDALDQRGRAYVGIREWDKAVADFTQVLDKKPDDAECWAYRGYAYGGLGLWEKAIADHSRAIELRPDDTFHLARRSRAYLSLNQWDKALADLSKAIELKPNEGFPWWDRGRAYHDKGQYEKAIADYTKFIKFQPDDVEAWTRRGHANGMLKQWDKALADYSQAIHLNPRDPSVWTNRSNTYLNLKRWREAIGDLTMLIELKFPDEPNAWFNRGSAHEQAQLWFKALADYSKALTLKPEFDQCRRARGQVFAEVGQWGKASADFAKLTEGKEIEQRVWSWHAMLLLRLGDCEGYRHACGRQWEIFSDRVKGADAARLVWTCSLGPDALADPGKVVNLAKKHLGPAPFYNPLAVSGAALLRAGKYQDAVKQLSLAVKSQKEVSPAWLLLAIAYQRLGNHAEANAWLNDAVRWMNRAEKEAEKTVVGQPTRWERLPWEERLTLQILRREAEDLIKKGSH